MLIVAFCFLCLLATLGNACMCAQSHPQENLCHKHSFAALVKIRSKVFVRVPSPEVKAEASSGITTEIVKRRANNNRHNDDVGSIIPTAAWHEKTMNGTFSYKKDTVTYLRYRIKIHKAFKGINATSSDNQKFFLYTAPHDSLCGRKFALKETYLVIGTIQSDRLMIGLCDYAVQWKTLQQAEKSSIRENMLSTKSICNSGCNVVSCVWSDCSPSSLSECTWNNEMEKQFGKFYNQANFFCLRDEKEKCKWEGITTTEPEQDINRKKRHSNADYSSRL